MPVRDPCGAQFSRKADGERLVMSHSGEEETVCSLFFWYQSKSDAELQPLVQRQHWDPQLQGHSSPFGAVVGGGSVGSDPLLTPEKPMVFPTLPSSWEHWAPGTSRAGQAILTSQSPRLSCFLLSSPQRTLGNPALSF